jgi:4'-phosphopantetheinyl transferase superfamily
MHIGIVQPDTASRRIEILRELLSAAGQSNTEKLKLVREPNGKQKLECVDGRKWHCNFSRVRNAPRIFGVVAISNETELGIDVEIWPKTAADPDFLDSVSTSDDARAIQSLARLNRDAGIALWVIKEAALKCSGDVMIDPRHLAVSESQDGFYRIGPSLLAGAPVPDVTVALFQMRASKWPDTEILCAIALPCHDRRIATTKLVPALTGVGWQIMALKTRTQS